MILHFSKNEHDIRPLSSMRIDGVMTDIKENYLIATIMVNHYFGRDATVISYDGFIKKWQWDEFCLFVKAHGNEAVISVYYGGETTVTLCHIKA